MKPTSRLLSLAWALTLLLTACLEQTPPAAATATRPPLASPTAAPSDTPTGQPLPLTETSSTPEPPEFNFRFERLILKTSLLHLEIKDGAVVFLRDKQTTEVLVDSDAAGQCELDAMLTAGFASKDAKGNVTLHCPSRFQNVTFTSLDAYRGKLTYQGMPDATDTRLEFDIAVDPQTGEVLVRLTGLETIPEKTPSAINLTLMSLKTPAIILGSGVKVQRETPAIETQTTESGYGLHGVTMAVIEGRQSVAAVWSESTQFAPEYIRLIHTPKQDHIILHSERDPKEPIVGQISSPVWRIGTYPAWVNAAARWQQEFEQRTGAKPLWENRTEWVRKVHAVFDSTNQLYGGTPEKYAELAALAAPEKVLFYLWNGDRIVLFGDHTLAAQIGRPDPEMLTVIEKYGWPLLLYHPFNLVFTENGAEDRLAYLAGQGWLPENYQFTPDYPGAPEDWFTFWKEARGDYDETLAILHPASGKFHQYLAQNFGNYTRRYGAEAAYMDVLGNDGISFFPQGGQIVDGQDYVTGERGAVSYLQKQLPQLGIMSEYQSSWLIPYTFYTWEGIETHQRQANVANTHLNHPLRTALLGSYMWTRETNSAQADDILAALLGTLPQVSLVGDYDVSEERARWSQERVKLFCDEELFNALPAQWDDDALAYYQSQKSGHWFKFVRIESSYGYVEILPNGEESVRLVK
jgi:hypothetical protein